MISRWLPSVCGVRAMDALIFLLIISLRLVYAVSPCDQNPCMNEGTCTVLTMSNNFTCVCSMGWTGDTCEVSLNQCDPNPCKNGGTCMDLSNNFSCMCTMGWMGSTCEAMSACNPNPCQHGGMCSLTPGNYECLCQPGFDGMNCGNDLCMPNPCRNGGMCIRQSTGNLYDCNCTAGFASVNCQDDRCMPNPCKNGGMCIRQYTGNLYDCNCTPGYVGVDCQDPISNPCQPNPCQNGGQCVTHPGGMHQCNCQNGATGNNCEIAAATSTLIIIVAVVVGVVIVVLLVVLIILVIYRVRKSPLRRSKDRTSNVERGHSQELPQRGRSNSYKSRTSQAKSLTGGGRSREFPRDRLHIMDKIGSGSFAVVYKAEAEGIVRKGRTATVAVKMLKESANSNDQKDFKKELHLYSMLDPHPNVLSMLGCCTENDPMYIILEYVPHGNLQTYLRHIRMGTGSTTYANKAEVKKDSLSPTEILTFACQVVRGMKYLASKQCIHRDLATRNILLGEGMICKVADFGLARDIAEHSQYEMQSQGRVPVRWMALESLLSNMYTSKSDVWSFGVLLWELVTLGSHPYPGMSSQKVISEIKKGYRLPKPDHCSDDIYKVMMDCWQEKPDDRPDFSRLHLTLEDLLDNATGYLEMRNLNQDDYLYLEPGQNSSIDSES